MILIRDEDVWIVTQGENSAEFKVIEDACALLEARGVKDEEIDFALTEMVSYDHNKAHFGLNGLFTYSERMVGET